MTGEHPYSVNLVGALPVQMIVIFTNSIISGHRGGLYGTEDQNSHWCSAS